MLESRIGLGTAQLGLRGYGISSKHPDGLSDEQAAAVISAALEEGLWGVDTSRAYGLAEERVGAAVSTLGARDSFELCTKLDPAACSTAEVDASVFRSLHALRRRTLSTIGLHSHEQYRRGRDGLSSVWSQLLQLKREGIVERLSVSVYSPEEALECLTDADVDEICIPLNPLDWRWAAHERWQEAMRERQEGDGVLHGRKVTISARGLFLQGLVFLPAEAWPPFASPPVSCEAVVGTLRALPGYLGLTDPLRPGASFDPASVMRLCFAFALSPANRWVDRYILGAESEAELRESLHALRSVTPLSEEQHTHLRRLTAPGGEAGASAGALYVGEHVLMPHLWPQSRLSAAATSSVSAAASTTAAAHRHNLSGRSITDFARSDAYRDEIHGLIPGGAHTYSKGDDQWPALSPAAIASGDGCHVHCLDGHRYLDTSLGLTSVCLGHCYAPVLSAATAQLALGNNFQRPAAIEREYARAFLPLVAPLGHSRIKMAKNGSTCTTAAIKLARAFTGRSLVAVASNHPFYAYDDWFIGTTPCSAGVPDAITALTLKFDSLRPETLAALFDAHPQQIAAIISEPDSLADAARGGQPPDAYRELITISHRHGAVFIADEMVSGFRSDFPGACTRHGYRPDIATWGKSIGNGFSVCCMTGTAAIMDCGGIKQRERPRVFLTSSTHGGEAVCLAAGLAVIRSYQQYPVIAHHHAMVAAFVDAMRAAVKAHELEEVITIVAAQAWSAQCTFRNLAGAPDAALRTLFLQEMVGRGVRAPTSTSPHTQTAARPDVRPISAPSRTPPHTTVERNRSTTHVCPLSISV